MGATFRRPQRRDGILSALNLSIEAMNLAESVSAIAPAKAVFGSAGVLLTMIRDSMANQVAYVELGLFCVDVCKALDRGIKGRRLKGISQPVLEAIERLRATVDEIQNHVVKQGKRNGVIRFFHAGSDKEAIAAWNLHLFRVLHIFSIELAMNSTLMAADERRRKRRWRYFLYFLAALGFRVG